LSDTYIQTLLRESLGDDIKNTSNQLSSICENESTLVEPTKSARTDKTIDINDLRQNLGKYVSVELETRCYVEDIDSNEELTTFSFPLIVKWKETGWHLNKWGITFEEKPLGESSRKITLYDVNEMITFEDLLLELQ